MPFVTQALGAIAASALHYFGCEAMLAKALPIEVDSALVNYALVVGLAVVGAPGPAPSRPGSHARAPRFATHASATTFALARDPRGALSSPGGQALGLLASLVNKARKDYKVDWPFMMISRNEGDPNAARGGLAPSVVDHGFRAVCCQRAVGAPPRLGDPRHPHSHKRTAV